LYNIFVKNLIIKHEPVVVNIGVVSCKASDDSEVPPVGRDSRLAAVVITCPSFGK